MHRYKLAQDIEILHYDTTSTVSACFTSNCPGQIRPSVPFQVRDCLLSVLTCTSGSFLLWHIWNLDLQLL